MPDKSGEHTAAVKYSFTTAKYYLALNPPGEHLKFCELNWME